MFSLGASSSSADHCSLCIRAKVSPAEVLRPSAFIFLEMGGVTIGERNCYLHADAIDYLHHLIIRIEYAGYRAITVLGTSWRNATTLSEFQEKIFPKHLTINICLTSKVAQEYNNAADAIEDWLCSHGFDPETTNFVAFNDDSSGALQRFGARFIHISSLLNEKDIERAAKILKV